MEGLIAFCNNPNCGTIFLHNGIFGGIAMGSASFKGCSIGPCPNCGGLGYVPDGIYNFFDNQIEFIRGPKSSLDALKKVKQLLRSFKKKEYTQEYILNEVNKVSPEVANELKKIPTKINYNQWIGTLIALISVIILIQQTYFNDKSDSEIKDQFIEYLLKENTELKNKKVQTFIPNKKIGRNDTCYCGSGIKYKKCCLPKDK